MSPAGEGVLKLHYRAIDLQPVLSASWREDENIEAKHLLLSCSNTLGFAELSLSFNCSLHRISQNITE